MHVLKVEMIFFSDEKCFNESERADYAHKRSRLVEDARGRTLYPLVPINPFPSVFKYT